MDVIESLFTVALLDFPGLPDKERMAAQARYARVLERQLGGHEAAAALLCQVLALEDGDETELGPDKIAALNRWAKAASAARQAGYQGLAELEGAYFEVRPV